MNAKATATMEQLLDAVLHVRSPEAFREQVTAALTKAFQDVSDAAWKHALESTAKDFERELGRCPEHGIPAHCAAVNIADLILALRVKAGKPPQLPAGRTLQ